MQSETYKISKIVALPMNTEPCDLIPPDLPFQGQAKVLEQIAVAIDAAKPVLIIGETGTGKTSAVRHLAAKTKNGFRRVNLHGYTGTDEIIGKLLLNKDGTYWLDGVLIDAMRKGYWILLDEINAASPDVLFSLHSLLDDDGYIVLSEHNGEIVRPHPNFRLFATMNPDYEGTKELNRALRSRFYVVKIGFPNKANETEILHLRTALPKKIAEKMVAFAGEIRGMKEKDTIQFVLSTRELLQWADLYHRYRKYTPSAEMAFLNKLEAGEITAVKDIFAIHFAKEDNPDKKVVEKAKVEPLVEPLKVGDRVRLTRDSVLGVIGEKTVGKIMKGVRVEDGSILQIETETFFGSKQENGGERDARRDGKNLYCQVDEVEKV